MCVSDVSSDLTFTCDFEASETGCVFHNAMGDNFDWTVYTVSNVIYMYLQFYFHVIYLNSSSSRQRNWVCQNT